MRLKGLHYSKRRPGSHSKNNATFRQLHINRRLTAVRLLLLREVYLSFDDDV